MIKKTVAITITLLTVMFTLGATSSYADTTGKVTVKNLNIRRGPSVKHRVIGIAHKDQEVTVLETKNGWHKIQMNNNQEAWLSGKYIEIKKEGIGQDDTSSNEGVEQINLKVIATAYTGYSTTSTGQKPVWGTIAVDPRVIPYGTKIYIPYFNRVFVANNTGGAIKGNKIDIYMNSRKECYSWGRKTIDIQILK